MTERYGWDQTPTPDLGLDISKAPSDIQRLYKWIIEKMYGKDVASAYGQAMVLTGILAKNAEAMSLFTSGRMDALDQFVRDTLIELTDKDVISAPEIIASRDGAPTLSDRLSRDFSEVSSGINFNKLYTNVISLGCKPNDDTFDNAPLIQAEIGRLSLAGGGKIFFPAGKWYVKSAISLKSWVGLVGVSKGMRNAYAYDSLFGSAIISSATTTNNVVRIDGREETISQYTWATSIEDLHLGGNDLTDYVLSQTASAYTTIKNVVISNGQNGLYCLGTMLDVWDNVNISGIRNYSIHVSNAWSKNTTMRFYNTYIGQSPFSTAIPIKVESYSTVDITFYSPTFETIPNGCEFGQAIIVKMIGVYCENFPSQGFKNAFRFGILGPSDITNNLNQRGTYSIDGMFYQGAITGWSDNTLFKFDNHKSFSCNDAYVRNVGNIISYDEIDKMNFHLSNWVSENGLISHNDIDKIDKTRLHAVNCQYGNNIILNNSPLKYLDVPLLNGWVNFGSGNQDYEVFLEDNRFINIVGVVKSGSSTIIAQIPAPYRPKNLVSVVALQIASSVWTPTMATVGITGDVTVGTSNTSNKSFNIRYKY